MPDVVKKYWIYVKEMEEPGKKRDFIDSFAAKKGVNPEGEEVGNNELRK